ncbi:hypothetical protein ACIP87_28645 [Streptomyces albidoflavus]|uniref:hypothetical protein n=1 Tax=Streptomyces albidoflavus TaxID=1886 RepID=UPI002E11A4A2|nr:hypothetical protein OG695_31485 [Streptomyces albidoflavus]
MLDNDRIPHVRRMAELWRVLTNAHRPEALITTVVTIKMGKTGMVDRAMRVVLCLYALVSIPMYLWFLHHAGDRCGQQLPADDHLRFWLPSSFHSPRSASPRCPACPGGGAPTTVRSSWAAGTGDS